MNSDLASTQLDLSVIIVNWNTRKMLRECLEKLPPAIGDITSEVIVIDNGSTDGSVQMLQSDFPAISLHQNQDNLGFPKAVNLGINASTGWHVALINSDIMVGACSIQEMVSYLRQHPRVAAVAPQLVGRQGHMQYSGGYAPSPVSAFMQLVELQALAGGRSHGLFVRSRPSLRPQAVDWLCAACMVVNRKAIDDAGMLDDSNFMYAEDVEYGIRLRRLGWEMHLLPWLRVVHYGGASSDAPEMRLMWLGGVFRVAAGRLSRPSYSAFGILLAAAYTFRYLLARILRITPGGKKLVHSEVVHLQDMRLYGRTALRLALREPGHAAEFCAKLEQGYRRSKG
ncbi:MAG: glycosyltransferase family 2 protein [Thermoleophilia bacterium]